MRIKDISSENRPRERLISQGPEALSDAELIAIILQKGTREENVVDMSNRLLSDGLEVLFKKSMHELTNTNGIGATKAIQIKAIYELFKRISLSKVNINKITCAKDVCDLMTPQMSSLDKEHFIVLLLDTNNKLIKKETISIGTLNSSIVHPREIFRAAIKENANSIILVHNHPSGDSEPSPEDKIVHKLVRRCGNIIGIELLDFIIIGNNNNFFTKNKY